MGVEPSTFQVVYMLNTRYPETNNDMGFKDGIKNGVQRGGPKKDSKMGQNLKQRRSQVSLSTFGPEDQWFQDDPLPFALLGCPWKLVTSW